MFNNIGGKIKGLAVACTIIGMIITLIFAIIFFVGKQYWIGIATLVGGGR